MSGGVSISFALISGAPEEMIYETDVSVHHRRVTDAVRRAGGRLVGAMTVNPLLDLDQSLSELGRLYSRERFRAIRLAPTAHGYLPHRCADLLDPVLEAAASLHAPVFISGGNPPYATPVLFADLAARHPRTEFVLCDLGSDYVSYVDEAIYVARRNPNVLLTTAGAPLHSLRKVVAELGPDRVVFGSGFPAHEPLSQLRTLRLLSERPPVGLLASADAMTAISGGNLTRLLQV